MNLNSIKLLLGRGMKIEWCILIFSSYMARLETTELTNNKICYSSIYLHSAVGTSASSIFLISVRKASSVNIYLLTEKQGWRRNDLDLVSTKSTENFSWL